MTALPVPVLDTHTKPDTRNPMFAAFKKRILIFHGQRHERELRQYQGLIAEHKRSFCTWMLAAFERRAFVRAFSEGAFAKTGTGAGSNTVINPTIRALSM